MSSQITIKCFLGSCKSNELILPITVSGGRNGMMEVTLSDGLNSAKPAFFRIRIRDVALALSRNEALDVFPMMRAPLTPDHLLVLPSDQNPDREINFIVKREPIHGRLLYREDPLGYAAMSPEMREVRNFTQRQVNNSQIFYEHDRPFANLTIFDGLNLEAVSDYAIQRVDIVFHIRISVSAMMSGGIDRFIGSDDITLEEGGNVVIATRDLNTTGVLQYLSTHQSSASRGGGHYRSPRLRLQFSQLPAHGFMVINGIKARSGAAFTQADVDRGYLSYHHDHSDTLYDTFGVSLYLEGEKVFGDGKGRQGDVLLYNGIWNITVLPVNDQKFRLLTDAPSMSVVQRQSKVITRDLLLAEDPDNGPAEIVYDIINSPASGRLFFAQNLNEDASRFTQEDIDQGRLLYRHDGSLKPVDFYFRVSDGKYEPVYRHFRIHVMPLEVRLTNRTVIEIQQGTRMAYISRANMGAATNGERARILYNVTKAPSGGQIYMNDAPARLFTQVNVDNEEVVFMQTDMSLSNDSFAVDVSNQDAILRQQVFEVAVVPLLKRSEPFIAGYDKNTALTQRHLDATQLSGLTNSNPVYFVLRAPKFGRIMRIVRSSGRQRSKRSVRDREVWQFSHEDVKNGVIHFVPDTKALNRQAQAGTKTNDSFVFRLVAPNVQPANGVFDFSVKPKALMASEETYTNSYPRGIKEKERMTEADGQMGNTLLIVLATLISLLVLIIVVCLAVKCRRDQKAKHRRHQHHHHNHLSNTNSISDGPKYSTDSLSTHHTHFGTMNRNGNGTIRRGVTPTHSIKSNGHAHGSLAGDRRLSTDYENGVLPMPTTKDLVASPKLNHTNGTLNRFPHIHSNGGTLKRPTTAVPPTTNGLTNGMTNGNSDSDSWMDSSRSRETSPASSIPPGMPAFRVIPLGGDSEHAPLPNDPTAFTTLGATNGGAGAFPRTSSNLGSDLGSNPGDRPLYGMYPRSGSEAGSNAPSDNTWNTPSGGLSNGGSQQPLLRRNQYWV